MSIIVLLVCVVCGTGVCNVGLQFVLLFVSNGLHIIIQPSEAAAVIPEMIALLNFSSIYTTILHLSILPSLLSSLNLSILQSLHLVHVDTHRNGHNALSDTVTQHYTHSYTKLHIVAQRYRPL